MMVIIPLNFARCTLATHRNRKVKSNLYVGRSLPQTSDNFFKKFNDRYTNPITKYDRSVPDMLLDLLPDAWIRESFVVYDWICPYLYLWICLPDYVHLFLIQLLESCGEEDHAYPIRCTRQRLMSQNNLHLSLLWSPFVSNDVHSFY